MAYHAVIVYGSGVSPADKTNGIAFGFGKLINVDRAVERATADRSIVFNFIAIFCVAIQSAVDFNAATNGAVVELNGPIAADDQSARSTQVEFAKIERDVCVYGDVALESRIAEQSQRVVISQCAHRVCKLCILRRRACGRRDLCFVCACTFRICDSYVSVPYQNDCAEQNHHCYSKCYYRCVFHLCHTIPPRIFSPLKNLICSCRSLRTVRLPFSILRFAT